MTKTQHQEQRTSSRTKNKNKHQEQRTTTHVKIKNKGQATRSGAKGDNAEQQKNK